MPRRVGMQKDLYTQLAEATTPEERDRIVRRLRHAETGQEQERGRVLDGLIVNGRDPFGDLRGGGRPVYDGDEREERTETTMTTQPTRQAAPVQLPGGVRPLDAVPAPAGGAKAKRKSPVFPDRRYEILYCPECRRQYQPEECEIERVDLVMTTRGGMTTTTARCKVHGQTIALKTEFIITVRGGAAHEARES